MFGVFSLIAYILSFFIIWLGAGLIIKSVDKIAEKLKLSAFAVSFFVLGILTSIPEMAISITAVIDKKPDYLLMLSWHIADELIPKLKTKGYQGKFIIPLPNIIISD